MEDGEPRKDKDAFLATLYRLDPDRLRQMRRIASGVTRCPECDAANNASERRCSKCGARLYPVEENDERLPWQDDDSDEGGPYKKV